MKSYTLCAVALMALLHTQSWAAGIKVPIANCVAQTSNTQIVVFGSPTEIQLGTRAQAEIRLVAPGGSLNSAPAYEGLVLQKDAKRKRLKVRGTIVLPIPIGAAIDFELTLTTAGGTGTAGGEPVVCAATRNFPAL